MGKIPAQVTRVALRYLKARMRFGDEELRNPMFILQGPGGKGDYERYVSRSYVETLAQTGGSYSDPAVKQKAREILQEADSAKGQERADTSMRDKARQTEPKKEPTFDEIQEDAVLTHADFPGLRGRVSTGWEDRETGENQHRIVWYDEKGTQLNSPTQIGGPQPTRPIPPEKVCSEDFPSPEYTKKPPSRPQFVPTNQGWMSGRDQQDYDAFLEDEKNYEKNKKKWDEDKKKWDENRKKSPWSKLHDDQTHGLWAQPDYHKQEGVIRAQDKLRVPSHWDQDHEVVTNAHHYMNAFGDTKWVQQFDLLDQDLSAHAAKEHHPHYDPSELSHREREMLKFDRGQDKVGELFLEHALTPDEREVWDKAINDLYTLRTIEGDTNKLENLNDRRKKLGRNPVGQEGGVELIKLMHGVGSKGNKGTFRMHTPIGRTKEKFSDEHREHLKQSLGKAMAFSHNFFKRKGIDQVPVGFGAMSLAWDGDAERDRDWDKEKSGPHGYLKDRLQYGLSSAGRTKSDRVQITGLLDTKSAFIGRHTGLGITPSKGDQETDHRGYSDAGFLLTEGDESLSYFKLNDAAQKHLGVSGPRPWDIEKHRKPKHKQKALPESKDAPKTEKPKKPTYEKPEAQESKAEDRSWYQRWKDKPKGKPKSLMEVEEEQSKSKSKSKDFDDSDFEDLMNKMRVAAQHRVLLEMSKRVAAKKVRFSS
jgi:hypothetical protein